MSWGSACPDADFWLCFDASGKICYCSRLLAGMLGRDESAMKGSSVTSIFPELPLNGKTPGYNVAAMTMNYVNRRRPITVTLAEDRRVPVEAAFRSISVGRGPVFLVELQAPHGPG